MPYSQISLRIPEELAEAVKIKANSLKVSMNAYIQTAIDERLEKDNGKKNHSEITTLTVEALQLYLEFAYQRLHDNRTEEWEYDLAEEIGFLTAYNQMVKLKKERDE